MDESYRIRLDGSRGETQSLKSFYDGSFPVVCIFTSLDFATFRSLEPASFYYSGHSRPIEFIKLTPATPLASTAIQQYFASLNIPMEDIFIEYMIAATSGHWRSIENMIYDIGMSRSIFDNEEGTRADRFNTLISSFEDLTGLFSSLLSPFLSIRTDPLCDLSLQTERQNCTRSPTLLGTTLVFVVFSESAMWSSLITFSISS